MAYPSIRPDVSRVVRDDLPSGRPGQSECHQRIAAIVQPEYAYKTHTHTNSRSKNVEVVADQPVRGAPTPPTARLDLSPSGRSYPLPRFCVRHLELRVSYCRSRRLVDASPSDDIFPTCKEPVGIHNYTPTSANPTPPARLGGRRRSGTSATTSDQTCSHRIWGHFNVTQGFDLPLSISLLPPRR